MPRSIPGFVTSNVQGPIRDVRATDKASAEQLRAAQDAVRAAIAAGQRQRIDAGIGGGALGAAGEPPAIPSLTSKTLTPLVLRRDLPLQPFTGPGALPAWSVGRAPQTLGPLIGGLGQSVFIDIFPPVDGTCVRRAAASSPILRVTGTTVTFHRGRGRIGRGSIWMPAPLFDSTAPSGSWFGLTVASGTISGAAAVQGSDGCLVIPDDASLTVELEFDAPPAPSGAGPGEDAREADVRLPSRATFVLSPTAGHVGEVAAALLTAYGETSRLDEGGGKPIVHFVPELAALLVVLRAHNRGWHPQRVASTLVSVGAGGRLLRAGWALPVTVADASTLGAAAGAGQLALQIDGLTLAVRSQAAIPLQTSWLVATSGLITIAADLALGAGLQGQLTLYPDPDGESKVGGRAAFRYTDQFALRYLSASSGVETLFAAVALDLSLDRPVTAAGGRVPLRSDHAVLALIQQASGTTLLLEGAGNTTPSAVLSFALENALLLTGNPALFIVIATVTSTSPLEAVVGKAAIVFPFGVALPTLPDPYVSTATLVARRQSFAFASDAQAAAVAGTTPFLLALLEWDARNGPVAPSVGFQFLGAQTTQSLMTMGPASATSATSATNVSARLSAAALVNDRTDANDGRWLTELAQLAERAAGSRPSSLALLDVSTAADQFGVRYGLALGDDRVGTAQSTGPVLQGLSILAPANTVRVITLPAVQWETVSGPDATGPFSPMMFPNSGGETQLTSQSQNLVSVAPKPALEDLVQSFNDQKAGNPGVVASITFPFGIRAVAVLNHDNGSNTSGAAVDLHQPSFQESGVMGGHQLRAQALGAGDPSFQGATVQLSNGLHSGVPTGLSAIDPLTVTFNTEFGPEGVAPRVPVGSFELSGYGESVFSDWKDDTDNVPAISEVRFDVLVGRTSVEVVQARSILYPYGVRVVRTIKMLRDNAGRVQRTDSGWQALTEGRYQWPRSDTRSHPGVVRGVTHVTNIRDTGQRFTTSQSTELMAVRFDCLVDLDPLGGVPSREQLGFIQMTVNPQPGMAASEFAELIEAFGPLGGNVNAVIELGGSGQRHRVTSVGVGVTPATTGPEFAMAAWGAPVLPKGGPWSVVRRHAGDPGPTPIDQTLGVPVIRAGVAGTAPSPSSPYRFADPDDLATPSAPTVEYALMHATNTYRALFPRPKIELTGPRAHQITSTEPPLVADPFLMSTMGVAPFPSLADAIDFPDADYGLRPLGGGELALDLAHNDFQVTGGDRTIHDSAGTSFLARYRDEGGTPSRVHLEIDSSKAVPWTFDVSAMELCLATSLMGEVMRVLGEVKGNASAPALFSGGTIHFGNALDSISVFTDFLGITKLHDLPIGTRNQPSLEIGLKIPIVGGPGEPATIDVGIGTLADADVTVGIKIDLSTGAVSTKFELEGIVTGRTPYPPLVAAGQVKFEIESNTMGNVFKFTLGFGVGVEGDIGPFKAEAYFFQNNYLVIGTAEIGFGIGVELKASIDFGIASAEVDVEAAALIINTSCPPTSNTLWLVAQLTIGVDLTICWVIDIDFEYQMQVMTNLDGGPCPAPMV